MNNGWKKTTLGEVASVLLSGVDKHILPGEAPVFLCNYLDVYRNRRLTKDMPFARGSARPGEIARFQLQRGDVIITKDSEEAEDIGVPAIVVDDLPNTICGYHLALIRPASGVVPQFLSHLLQSDTAKRHFLRTANGVTRFGLGLRAIATLPLSLPPPPEQATIARLLDGADAALECTRAAVQQAKTLKSAIAHQFFFAALGATAYADRPRKKLPKGWSLAPAEALLAQEPKNGASPTATSQPPGIPTFSIAAVREGLVNLDKQENLKYVQLTEKVADKFRIRRGDVLIVRGNANPDLVGKAGMIDRFPEGCIYPDITKRVVFRAEGTPTVTPAFAVLAWNHPIIHNQVLRRAKTSNGTLKINSRDVKQIIMPVPPPEAQTEIVELTAAVGRTFSLW